MQRDRPGKVKMKTMIDEDTLNTAILYCIDEYVRSEEDRLILKARWFKGKSLKELYDDSHKSDTCIKKLFRTTGKKILLRAASMKASDIPPYYRNSIDTQ